MNDVSENRMDPSPAPLVDTNQRTLDYLRVSITDRCNLNCAYCLPLSGQPKQSHDDILRYEVIIRLVRIFSDLGISKIRITVPVVSSGRTLL